MGNQGVLREIIYSVDEKCVGCNKCIRNCPIVGANVSYLVEGGNKVRVDQEKCIRCGACLDACSHDARQFRDDTASFFEDLGRGAHISVIAAPAARVNFENHRRLIGYLKSCGVNLVYDVSFGADITTWAYLKAIREKGLTSVVAQPCPAIVNYIEKYQSDLIPRLAPIHSPTLCTAIYLKKYVQLSDRIAFLSPCIGKTDEFQDANTGGAVSYNVTYRKLYEYVKEKGIDLSRYDETEFDDIGCWLGCLYGRPGGLRENVEALVPGAWVRQIEGKDHAYPYLKEYGQRLTGNRTVPLLVDILNCSNGCNRGTATMRNVSIDDSDASLNALKFRKVNEKKSGELFAMFDEKLTLTDFMRVYTDRTVTLKEPSADERAIIFGSLYKDTEESRKIDCSACGYDTCELMVKAIHNGINDKTNCIRFNQQEIALEAVSIREKTQFIDEMAGYTEIIVSVLGEAASLNFDVEVTGDFKGEFGTIKDSINHILETLDSTLRIIRDAADQFSSGAEQVSQDSTSLADGSSEQAEAVGKLSSLLAMLTQKTDLNTKNAHKAQSLTSSAKDAAVEGNWRMNDLLKSMQDINASSSNIGKILETIESIAFQTNILALNAAIEAARAGKYGKGFAVVANEVRMLSKKCSDAVRESAALIEESVSRVATGTGIANDTAAVLGQIVQRSSEIAGIVQTIVETSNEQSEGIHTINLNVQHVSQVVQSNSDVSHQSAETTAELSRLAGMLKNGIFQFTLRKG